MLPILYAWGGTIIYSYPLFIGLSWGVAYRLCESRRPQNVPNHYFTRWFLGVFLSSWIGAKLLFLATQDQFAVSDLARAANFWLGGGFVFLGGFFGGLFFTVLYGLLNTDLNWKKMQFTIVPLLWAHAIGRIGCLLAGCCFGTSTDLPWAIHLHGSSRHPVQLYEALALIGLTQLLRHRERLQQAYLVQYLIGYGAIRWSLEWLRGDEIRGLMLGMSTSQWVAIGMIIMGMILYFRGLRRDQLAG